MFMTKEFLGVVLFGLFCGSIFAILAGLYIPMLPRRVKVFNERCKRRFFTMFTGYTQVTIFDKKMTVINLENGEKITTTSPTLTLPIPNILIVSFYLFCCVMAIILLP